MGEQFSRGWMVVVDINANLTHLFGYITNISNNNLEFWWSFIRTKMEIMDIDVVYRLTSECWRDIICGELELSDTWNSYECVFTMWFAIAFTVKLSFMGDGPRGIHVLPDHFMTSTSSSNPLPEQTSSITVLRCVCSSNFKELG